MLLSSILFVCHHTGPAKHIIEYSQVLKKSGIHCEIRAKDAAIDALSNAKIAYQTYQKPEEIAKIAHQFSHIITDISPSSIPLLQTLKEKEIVAQAYCDNPEKFVEGGYSEQLEKIQTLAARMIYANPTLVTRNNDLGIGYSPAPAQAEKIRQIRASSSRTAFFEKHNLKDTGQQIVVFMGGANEYYYSKAFPHFISLLQNNDFSKNNVLFVLQQHPNAPKDGNPDWKKCQESFPKMILSQMKSDEILSIADTVLYNQTSMSPVFGLSGIPSYRVGLKNTDRSNDVLTRLGATLITTPEELSQIFAAYLPLEKESIYQEIGYTSNWRNNLQKVLHQ